MGQEYLFVTTPFETDHLTELLEFYLCKTATSKFFIPLQFYAGMGKFNSIVEIYLSCTGPQASRKLL